MTVMDPNAPTTHSDPPRIADRNVDDHNADAISDKLCQCEPILVAYCRTTTGNAADARDLVQDVFIRACRKLETLKDHDAFGPWLMGIARMVCKEWIRSTIRRRKHHTAHAIHVANQSHTHPPADPDQHQTHESLRHAMQQLPHDHQLAIHAFYSTDGGITRVCHVLNMSRASAYRLLADARTQLRTLMESQETSS